MLAQSIAIRIPMMLSNSGGMPVTGALPINFLNSSLYITKGDGTVVALALVSSGPSQNFFEIDSVNTPGLYHVLVPASATNVVGSFAYTTYPAASLFLLQTYFNEVSATDTTLGLVYQYLFGNQSLDANSDRLIIYKADGVTPLISYYLTDRNGQPSIFNVYNKRAV